MPPVVAAVVPAALWVLLAWRSPTSTHHFAPLVVAAAWGFFVTPVGHREAARAAIGGVGVALAALFVLLAADRLQGPTLWGARPAYPELIGFALIGGAITMARSAFAAPRAETP